MSRLGFGSMAALLFVVAAGCSGSSPFPQRFETSFGGEVLEGETFRRSFGPGYQFVLLPTDHGWLIQVFDDRGDTDISRYHPPLHAINPRSLDGWHFRNSDNTRMNETGPKNVNAPQTVRNFSFSPEIDRGFDARKADREDWKRIWNHGLGRLTIDEFGLGDLEPNTCARFTSLRFRVELSWPVEEGQTGGGGSRTLGEPLAR